jgi:hypothetical protein
MDQDATDFPGCQEGDEMSKRKEDTEEEEEEEEL